MRARGLLIGGIAVAAVAYAASVNMFEVQNRVCTARWRQPELSDMCGALRLGDRPTLEERTSFAALPPGDCQALSDWRARHVQSPLRRRADALLAARRESTVRWNPRTVRLAIEQPPPDKPAPAKAAARLITLDAAGATARAACSAGDASGVTRFVDAHVVGPKWTCERRRRLFRCSLTATAVCEVQQAETIWQCMAPD